MALLDQKSGCKVGWLIYDNEQEALKASERAVQLRDEMFKHGYDFGYQWPGTIHKFENHKDWGCDVWVVCTP